VALAAKIAQATGESVHLYGPDRGPGAQGRFDGTVGNPPRPLSLDLHRLWQKAELSPAGLERLLSRVTPEQAVGLSRWLPPSRVDAIGADAALTKRTLALDERVGPLLGDEGARAGILRLTEAAPKGRSKPTGNAGILDILEQLPADQLRAALRMMGDPAFIHPQQFQWKSFFGKRTADMVDMLRFVDEYGYVAWTELGTAKLAAPLRADLAARADAGARQARVEELLDLSTVARELELGVRRPPPYRKLTEAKADTSVPEVWKRYVEDATRVLDRNAELTGPRRKAAYGEGNAAAIEAYATILQVRDRVRSSWKTYQQDLSYDAKIKILDQIDALGEKGDLQHTWVNNLRGSIGEALFGPNGGQRQVRLANPLHPAKPRQGAIPGEAPRPGFTRLDDTYAPRERPRGPGGHPAGAREWLEIKTDRIDAPSGTDVSRDAVDTAKGYRKDAIEDWDALMANAKTRGDRLVMQFVRKPRTEATKAAMLKELFSKESPVTAVRFGEDAWIERPADVALPDVHPKLKDGPIVK
jgi:hypothetical protein